MEEDLLRDPQAGLLYHCFMRGRNKGQAAGAVVTTAAEVRREEMWRGRRLSGDVMSVLCAQYQRGKKLLTICACMTFPSL